MKVCIPRKTNRSYMTFYDLALGNFYSVTCCIFCGYGWKPSEVYSDSSSAGSGDRSHLSVERQVKALPQIFIKLPHWDCGSILGYIKMPDSITKQVV
jgi:hypothetical protein